MEPERLLPVTEGCPEWGQRLHIIAPHCGVSAIRSDSFAPSPLEKHLHYQNGCNYVRRGAVRFINAGLSALWSRDPSPTKHTNEQTGRSLPRGHQKKIKKILSSPHQIFRSLLSQRCLQGLELG